MGRVEPTTTFVGCHTGSHRNTRGRPYGYPMGVGEWFCHSSTNDDHNHDDHDNHDLDDDDHNDDDHNFGPDAINNTSPPHMGTGS